MKVSRKIESCFEGVLRLHWGSLGVSRKFQKSYGLKVSRKIEGCFEAVLRVI